MQTYATQQIDDPGMQEFQAFYEDNLVRVYRFVFTHVRNKEEAEDLTSQIFLKALHYLALTSSLDARLEVGWEGPIEEVVLGTNERAVERVYNLLQALPERYGEVLRCRFLLNLSIRETAATMGISEANVKILQFRAIKHATRLANQEL
jgi:RNA polymerase sigma-70 factor (ECF subfamily)